MSTVADRPTDRPSLPLVLASRSPRRRRLLDRVGAVFEVEPSTVNERFSPELSPEEAAETLALRKARQVASGREAVLVLGADTLVALENEILEKPDDSAQALAMLHRLAGRTHRVCTGLALVRPDTRREITAVEETRVTFAPLETSDDEELLRRYVETGDPMDKAGAYGIQDELAPLFVEGIEGDYYNVVGLPLFRLRRLLRTSPEFLPDPPPLWNLPTAQSYESTDSDRSSTES